MKHTRSMSPCEMRLADIGIDVYTRGHGDEDECHWRSTLIDRCEAKIVNLTVDCRELVLRNLELQRQLEELKHDRIGEQESGA